MITKIPPMINPMMIPMPDSWIIRTYRKEEGGAYRCVDLSSTLRTMEPEGNHFPGQFECVEIIVIVLGYHISGEKE